MARDLADDQELIEIDEATLTAAIVKLVGEEIGAQTRAALNQVLGRLD